MRKWIFLAAGLVLAACAGDDRTVTGGHAAQGPQYAQPGFAAGYSALPNDDLLDLKVELDTDPLGRGYGIMNDAQAAADLNTVYRQETGTVLAPEVLRDQVDKTEYLALTDRQASDMQWLASDGPIDVSPGSFGRGMMLDMFSPGGATIANLLAELTDDVSRAVELFGRPVTELDVARARALP